MRCPMQIKRRLVPLRNTTQLRQQMSYLVAVTIFVIFACPIVAFAQSAPPFDSGFTSLQNLFTGTIAKVASLIAIVIGGYTFAHGVTGANKALAGVAAGTGIAVLAVNVLSWLWGG